MGIVGINQVSPGVTPWNQASGGGSSESPLLSVSTTINHTQLYALSTNSSEYEIGATPTGTYRAIPYTYTLMYYGNNVGASTLASGASVGITLSGTTVATITAENFLDQTSLVLINGICTGTSSAITTKPSNFGLTATGVSGTDSATTALYVSIWYATVSEV